MTYTRKNIPKRTNRIAKTSSRNNVGDQELEVSRTQSPVNF